MIPKDWKKSPISQICELIVDCVNKTAPVLDNETPYRMVRTSNIRNGRLRLDNAKHVNLETYEKWTRRAKVIQEDILLTREAPVGEIAIINREKNLFLGQRIMQYRPDRRKVNPKFLYYSFLSDDLQKQFNYHGDIGSTVSHIRVGDCSNFIMSIPPLPEQNKIAEVLVTWDEAIDLLEKLITAKHKLKQGLMQQLLTGKKHFQGFETYNWKSKILIEITEILVSPVDKLTVDGEKPVRLCNYTDVYKNNRITRSIAFMQATATEKEIAKFIIKKGDVIITKDSESPKDIAIPAYVSEDLDGVICGYHLAILRPIENAVDGEYLGYLLATSEVRYYFFRLANGATRFGLSVSSIENARFNLPSIPEQIKIVYLLSSVDNEISLLEKQLAAYKQQKRGLMQQLLTGKKRLN
jgi:type I restriction enzyme, S subunit